MSSSNLLKYPFHCASTPQTSTCQSLARDHSPNNFPPLPLTTYFFVPIL